MKLAKGETENGIVIGNTFDKYGSNNPFVRRLLHGFGASLLALVHKIKPSSIHEVGCGEGFWTIRLQREGFPSRGTDFSSKVISIAKTNACEAGIEIDFRVRSIYDLIPPDDNAELVVCCEVLEHLHDPEAAVEKLASVANPYMLASVPREPIWSLFNLARGKYLSSLGNTPGHVQKWSSRAFTRLLNERFHIVDLKMPLPWTMVLCKNIS